MKLVHFPITFLFEVFLIYTYRKYPDNGDFFKREQNALKVKKTKLVGTTVFHAFTCFLLFSELSLYLVSFVLSLES